MKLYGQAEWTQADLAEMFGVSVNTIYVDEERAKRKIAQAILDDHELREAVIEMFGLEAVNGAA